MSDDKIIELIKQKLKEGVSEKELSNYLSDTGYSLYDIDKILTQAKRELEGKKQTPLQEIILRREFNKNKKYLITLGVGFLVLVGFVFFILNFLNSPSVDSSLLVINSNSNVLLGNLSSEKKILFLGNGEANFNFNNVNHSLSILKIVDDEVYLIVSSNPMVFSFRENDIRRIDLNNDNLADVEIILISFNSGEPIFKITKIRKDIQADVPDYFLNKTQDLVNNSNLIQVPKGACSEEGGLINLQCVDGSHLKYAICFNNEWVVNIKSCPSPTYSLTNGFVKSACENNECKIVSGCDDGFVLVNYSNNFNLKYCCNKTEDNETICNDSLDNDCDGSIDVMDNDCSWYCESNQSKVCVLPDNSTGVMNCINGSWANCSAVNVSSILPLINASANENVTLKVNQSAKLVDCDNLIFTLTNVSEKVNSFNETYFYSDFVLTNNTGFNAPLGLSEGSGVKLNLSLVGYYKQVFFYYFIESANETSSRLFYNCSVTECTPNTVVDCITDEGCAGTETCGKDGFYGSCVDVPDDNCPVSISPPPSNAIS